MPKKLKEGEVKKVPYSISIDSRMIGDFEEACAYFDSWPSREIRKFMLNKIEEYNKIKIKKKS